MVEDCGLDDLWCEVYARNSLRQMMDGKSYSKTLRACLLTDAALHKVLLTCDFHSPQALQGDEVLSEVSEVCETSIYDDEEEFQYFFDDDFTNVGLEETVPANTRYPVF